jgi:hypothetical protein
VFIFAVFGAVECIHSPFAFFGRNFLMPHIDFSKFQLRIEAERRICFAVQVQED